MFSEFFIYNFKLKLFLLDTRLWDDLELGLLRLNHHWSTLTWLHWRWDNRRELDGSLLELLCKLLVQEIANHENCDKRHNVENIERRLGRNLLNDCALRVINNWWWAAH